MLLQLLRYPYANTRCRFLAAGFLKPHRLGQLASQPSRAEAAAFLEPFFKLPPASWAGVEQRLRAEYHLLGRKVARTLPGRGRRLVEAYLRRAETENLKMACRGLLRGRSIEEFQHLFLPAVPVAGIAGEQLLKVRTLEDLLRALRRRPLARAIRQGLAAAEEQRLLSIELALDRADWEALGACLADLGGADRAAAGELLALRADLDRFNLVHRGWRAGLPEGELLAALPPLGTACAPGELRRALRGGDPETALGRLFPLSGLGAPLSTAGEVALARRLFRHLRKTMRSHPFDLAIPLATVLLKELESRDVQAILSGLRLGRRREEITPLLACVEEE